jgi:hypothetical protein
MGTQILILLIIAALALYAFVLSNNKTYKSQDLNSTSNALENPFLKGYFIVLVTSQEELDILKQKAFNYGYNWAFAKGEFLKFEEEVHLLFTGSGGLIFTFFNREYFRLKNYKKLEIEDLISEEEFLDYRNEKAQQSIDLAPNNEVINQSPTITNPVEENTTIKEPLALDYSKIKFHKDSETGQVFKYMLEHGFVNQEVSPFGNLKKKIYRLRLKGIKITKEKVSGKKFSNYILQK